MIRQASVAVVSMTADSELRMGNIEGLCTKLFLPCPRKKQSRHEAIEM